MRMLSKEYIFALKKYMTQFKLYLLFQNAQTTLGALRLVSSTS